MDQKDTVRGLIATYHGASRDGRPELQNECINGLKTLFGMHERMPDSTVIAFARMRLMDDIRLVLDDDKSHIPFREDFFDEELFRI